MLIHEQGPERQFPVACSFPGCDFRRRVVEEIKLHERGHWTLKVKLKCEICPTKFGYPDKNSLLFHKYLRHNAIPFKCSMCVYGVLHKSALSHHIRDRHGRQNLKSFRTRTTTSNSSEEKCIQENTTPTATPTNTSNGHFQSRLCGLKGTKDQQSTFRGFNC